MRCNNVIKVVYRTGASKASAKIYRFGVKVVKIDILYNHHRSQYRRLIGSRPSCFTYLNYLTPRPLLRRSHLLRHQLVVLLCMLLVTVRVSYVTEGEKSETVWFFCEELFWVDGCACESFTVDC